MDLPCIICLKTNSDNVGDVFNNFLNDKKYSSHRSDVYCHIFNVNTQKLMDNFEKEYISFCTECLTCVKELTELLSQLECVKKSIQNILHKTKIKIILSDISAKINHFIVRNPECFTEYPKYEYFRKQAIKDLNPTIKLQRVTAVNCVTQDKDFLQQSRNKIKKENEYLDEDPRLLLVTPGEIQTEIKDETDEAVPGCNESDVSSLLPRKGLVVFRNIVDTVKTRRNNLNKVLADDYGEDDGADGEHCSAAESDLSDNEKTTRKKKKRKRDKPGTYKGVAYSMTAQSDSPECKYKCEKCFKEFRKEEHVRDHIRRIHLNNIVALTPDGKELTKRGTVKIRFFSQAVNLGDGKWSYKDFEYTKDKTSGKCQCVLCEKYYKSAEAVHSHIKFCHVRQQNVEHFKKFTLRGTPRKVQLSKKLGDDKRLFEGVEYRIENDPEDKSKQLYHCGLCDLVRPNTRTMHRHITSKHSNSETRECCGKKFYSKTSFDEHFTQLHKNDGSATCEECGKTFKYKTALYAHKRRIHLGERRFICEFCGKRFFTNKDCRLHSATHHANKPSKSEHNAPQIEAGEADKESLPQP